MTATVAHKIDHFGVLLQSATKRQVVYKPYGDNLPYRWELVSRQEPQYIQTIQLTASDIVSLHEKSDGDRVAYLLARFGYVL